ncbi:ATP-binding domain-containing protein [Thermobifida cellulosilytica]|uniref:ATP-binding domain-containing protein n=1 Tax=Thermobifida cellulosilytica TaxID=144786 RepID=UPI0009FE82BC
MRSSVARNTGFRGAHGETTGSPPGADETEFGQEPCGPPGPDGPRRPGRPVAALTPVQAKGLEFAAVVVLAPAGIAAAAPQGGRDLYVAITRAASRPAVVHEGPLPPVPKRPAAGPLPGPGERPGSGAGLSPPRRGGPAARRSAPGRPRPAPRRPGRRC